ncbi:hypothetical protein SAMN05421780_11255 [Flexibacter flexilis DSM 6793]|uniref:Uncharacterized protein n=1 Tax=Flexibacter flexilis DSM 6793 TaxID=927664 RepID=A0A1I1N376_9BACT|nr:hypothetical protein SAMN05421780_11255 [Flexibacter flexilis DSM 6793]
MLVGKLQSYTIFRLLRNDIAKQNTIRTRKLQNFTSCYFFIFVNLKLFY